MSFKVYSVRKELEFNQTFEKDRIRYTVSDPHTGTFYTLGFVQFQILKFFQMRPASPFQCAEFLEKKLGLEFPSSDVEKFMEGSRNKNFLQFDHHTIIDLKTAALLGSQIKETLIAFSKKYWEKNKPTLLEKQCLTDILTHLRAYKIHEAVFALDQHVSEHPKNVFLQRLNDVMKPLIFQKIKDTSVSEKLNMGAQNFSFFNPLPFLEKHKNIIFSVLSIGPGLVFLFFFLIAMAMIWNLGILHTNIAQNTQFAMQNYLWLMVMSQFNIAVHEMGHAIALFRCGGKPRRIGFLLFLGIMPAFFADVTEAYSLPRLQRIIISAAGVIAQTVLAVLLILIYPFFDEGTLVSQIIRMNTLTWIMGAFFNLMPIFKLDGYYIFSDVTGVENLFAKSYAFIKACFTKLFFGENTFETLSRYEIMCILFYSTLTFATTGLSYTMMVISAIVLWDNIQSIPRIFFFVMLVRMLFNFFFGTGVKTTPSEATSPKRSLKEIVQSLGKYQRSGVIALVGLALLSIPFPFRTKIPSVIRYDETLPVRAPESGLVHQIYFQEGTLVSAQAPLIEIRNPTLQREFQRQIYLARQKKLIFSDAQKGADPNWVRFYQTDVEAQKLILAEQENYYRTLGKDRRLVSGQSFEETLQNIQTQRKTVALAQAQQNVGIQNQTNQQEKLLELDALIAKERLMKLQSQMDQMLIRAPQKGQILSLDTAQTQGKFFNKGDLLFEIASGHPQIYAKTSEKTILFIEPKQSFTFVSVQGTVLKGHIEKVASISQVQGLQTKDMTQMLAGLSIFPTDSAFTVVGKIDFLPSDSVLHSYTTGTMAIHHGFKPLGYVLFRRLAAAIHADVWSIF